MYAVVVYLCDNSTGVVPEEWIDSSNMCYYPPCKSGTKLSKILKEKQSPGEDWPKFKIRKLGCADTYEKALKKAKKSEETSDLHTTDNSDIESVNPKRKRITQKPGRFLNSDSDSDDSEVDARSLQKSKTFVVPKLVAPSFPLNSSVGDKNCGEPPFKDGPEEFQTVKDLLMGSAGKNKEFEQANVNNNIAFRSAENDNVSTTVPSASQNKTNMQHGLEDVIKKIFVMLETNRLDNEYNKRLLTKIYRVVEKKTPDSIPNLPDLPLKEDDDIKKLEELLNLVENRKILAQLLSVQGGNGIQDCTRNIMKALMSLELAENYNWAGRGNKLAFRDLRVKDVIFDAVRISTGSVIQNTEVIYQIQEWLKHAKDRRLTKKKRETSQMTDNQL